MYPRLTLDLSWWDLGWIARQCLWSTDTGPLLVADAQQREAMAMLSVRSAFDLLLAALDLPPGSEALVSEVTVPHIARILREHQLVPVAVPVDPRTLGVSADDVAERLTERSRLVLVAHLFGSRMPLDRLGEVCRQRDLLLVEDSAQALQSGTPARDPAADVSLFSFGPIKTATALGGGIALVRDHQLREQMIKLANNWPRQSTRGYLARAAKMALLKLLSQPRLFSCLVEFVERTGGDADHFVGNSARGFPDDRLFAALRQQPCRPLAQCMARRLRRFDQQRIVARTQRAQQLSRELPDATYAAGCDNASHTFWVFPLVCPDPSATVAKLRQAGFDASQISGLTRLGDTSTDHWFHRTVFVPVSISMPQQAIEKLASILKQC